MRMSAPTMTFIVGGIDVAVQIGSRGDLAGAEVVPAAARRLPSSLMASLDLALTVD